MIINSNKCSCGKIISKLEAVKPASAYGKSKAFFGGRCKSIGKYECECGKYGLGLMGYFSGSSLKVFALEELGDKPNKLVDMEQEIDRLKSEEPVETVDESVENTEESAIVIESEEGQMVEATIDFYEDEENVEEESGLNLVEAFKASGKELKDLSWNELKEVAKELKVEKYTSTKRIDLEPKVLEALK